MLLDCNFCIKLIKSKEKSKIATKIVAKKFQIIIIFLLL